MKVHCKDCGQKPHVRVLWNVPNCNGTKKLLGLGWAPGAGPGLHPWQPSGHPGTFQSRSPRPITPDLTQPAPPTLPRPLSSVGPLCPLGLLLSTPPTLVSLALTHPLTLCLDTLSAGNPLLTPLPAPPRPDSHAPAFISTTAILQGTAVTVRLLLSPSNCEHLRVE